MPIKISGSWDKSKAQWTIMIAGQRHKRTARQLGCEPTKEASASAWMQYVHQLQGSLVPVEEKQRASRVNELQALRLNAADEQEAGELAIVETLVKTMPADKISNLTNDYFAVSRNVELAQSLGIVIPDNLPPDVLSALFGRVDQWEERQRASKPVDPKQSVGTALSTWLAECELAANRGHTVKELKAWVAQFKAEVAEVAGSAVASIDEAIVTKYWHWLLSKKYSPNAHNKRLGFFRRFVLWCRSSRLIESEPLNLKQKNHRKKETHVEPKTFTNVWKTLKTLPLPQQLWAMLGLNCGMTQTDLGQLKWDMIKGGILTRRRVKTGERKEVPTVRYKLWKETLELLQQIPVNGEYVFTSKKGTPMHSATKDLFYLAWQRMPVECPITLAKFRSIGATALKTDSRYREYVELFLGHTAKSVADKHYAAEAWKPFYEATDYIRDYLIS